MKISLKFKGKLQGIVTSALLILLAQGTISHEAFAGSSRIYLKQTGLINRTRIFQEGSDNLIVGSRSDGSIDSSIPAQQLNSVGGTLNHIEQQQGGNQLGLYQKSQSLSGTALSIKQRNGNKTLTIKQHVTSGDYRVTVTQ